MELITRIITALVETHPLHSMTVHFPIGLAGAALFFLLLALWQRSETLERAAFYNMALLIIGVAVAGLTGYRDYIVRFEGDAPYANVKIFLAITLFVLATAIVIARWRQPEILWKPSTMLLYVSAFAGCFALATTLGFLGGVILYGF